MTDDQTHVREEIDVRRIIPIVVGSSLRAERHDRPLGYALAERIAGLADLAGLEPVVCTDMWYLNDSLLCERAAISLGGPSENALSAHLASRVPSAFVVDDVLMVQFDVEAGCGHACCWGINPEATAAAIESFLTRYARVFVAGCSTPLV